MRHPGGALVATVDATAKARSTARAARERRMVEAKIKMCAAVHQRCHAEKKRDPRGPDANAPWHPRRAPRDGSSLSHWQMISAPGPFGPMHFLLPPHCWPPAVD